VGPAATVSAASVPAVIVGAAAIRAAPAGFLPQAGRDRSLGGVGPPVQRCPHVGTDAERLARYGGRHRWTAEGTGITPGTVATGVAERHQAGSCSAGACVRPSWPMWSAGVKTARR
jgi:hypothetical protein